MCSVTDGTKTDSSLPVHHHRQRAQGIKHTIEANTFLLYVFDHYAVQLDQRTYLFIIYVFSYYKRLMASY